MFLVFLKSNKPTTMSQSNPCHFADLHFEFIIDFFWGGRTDDLQLDFFGGCQKNTFFRTKQ